MKLLKKIVLINWHYLRFETLELDKINFLTGKNGAGKTTIIDAIQLLMLGDTTGHFFNKSASDKSSRTLKGYLRCEIGDDDNGNMLYLRNGRFTSYVVGEFYDDVNDACRVSLMQSRMTHYDPDAAMCCEAYTRMVYFALRHTIDATKKFVRMQRNVLVEKGFLPTEGNPDGYVKNSLRVMFDAILSTNTFTDAVLYAVNLGGDADTNAAIVGGLAGAMYGINGIPNDWYFALDDQLLVVLNEAAGYAVL